jgi:hypothetical protein
VIDTESPYARAFWRIAATAVVHVVAYAVAAAYVVKANPVEAVVVSGAVLAAFLAGMAFVVRVEKAARELR